MPCFVSRLKSWMNHILWFTIVVKGGMLFRLMNEYCDHQPNPHTHVTSSITLTRSNSIPRVDRVGVSSSNNSSGSSANSTMPQMLPHRNSTTPSEMEVHGNLVDLSGTLKTGSKDTSAGNHVAQGNYTKKSSNIEITGLGSRATQRSSNSIASNSQVICASEDKQGGDTAVPSEQTGSDLLKNNKFATADNKIAAASSSLDNSKDNKPEHNTNEKRSMRKRTAQAHEQEEERKSTNSLKTGTNNISANGPSKKTRAT